LTVLPSLFLSHGAPTLPLTEAPARQFLAGLGRQLGKPSAIVVASAHWETATPTVNNVARNPTIHDFYGFPAELYRLAYPAPGSAGLAEIAADLLCTAGLACQMDHIRGLDHGAWVPLLLMYPQADIPVVQISLQPHLGPAHHMQIGQALAPLRQQDVLIIGSGSLTHDLSRFRGMRLDSRPPADVTDFADWMEKALLEDRTCDLLTYRRLAPAAMRNHPSEEHLLPLFVALGAAAADDGHHKAEQLHRSSTYGVLRMDAYAFH
jgi:4,5-DOPA dioxygenase extradiol